MRRSSADKQRSHDRIVEIAAHQIRERGTDAPGVAEIMNAAGMTHGGFYKHFSSRDQLIGEATRRACADAGALLDRAAEAEDPLRALVDAYLSAEHRDDASGGCALAALAGDAARRDNPAREPLSEQARRYIDAVQGLRPPSGSPDLDRARAIATTSQLVGALILARAVDDPSLSDEILAAGRDGIAAVQTGA